MPFLLVPQTVKSYLHMPKRTSKMHCPSSASAHRRDTPPRDSGRRKDDDDQMWQEKQQCCGRLSHAKDRQMLEVECCQVARQEEKPREVIIIECVKRLGALPRDRWVTERLANVLRKLAKEVTSWGVVADSEVRRHAAASVGKTAAGAVVGCAADLGGALPDDLGEVAPAIESGVVVDVRWGRLAEKASEVADLVVVEELGDDRGDVAGWRTGSNVLAVASTVGRGVVSVDARASDLLSRGGQTGIPRESWSRVVGTVSIVMRNNGLAVVSWGCLTSARVRATSWSSWRSWSWRWLIGLWNWSGGYWLWSSSWRTPVAVVRLATPLWCLGLDWLLNRSAIFVHVLGDVDNLGDGCDWWLWCWSSSGDDREGSEDCSAHVGS